MDRTRFLVKFYLRLCAAGMPGDVIDALLEDEEKLAAHVRAELYISVRLWRTEIEMNLTGREDIARKATHPLHEIAQVVLLRINRPDDVAHRFDQFVRDARYLRERLGQLAVVAVDVRLRH